MEHKPNYEELLRKLADMEAVFRALRNEEVDAIVGAKNVFMLRLKETEDELQRQRSYLEELLAERTKLLQDLKIHQGELETQADKLRQAQRESRESRDRYRALYDYAPVGYLTLDREGNVFEANLTAARLLGLEKNELIRSRFTRFIEPESLAGFSFCMSETLEADTGQKCEIKMHKSNGFIYSALLESMAVKDSGGNPDHIRTILTDITERKQAEEALQRKTKDLEEANTELQQFAYVASHDLREPLRMITGFTQSLEKRYKDKLDKTANEYIDFIVDGAARMQALIDDILAYSRVGTRGIPFEPVNMEKTLKDVLVNLMMFIDETRAKVTHAPLPVIQADPVQMTQVLQNLVGNAVKFYKEGESPVIHVSARQEGEEWVFSVTDNGIGIDPELFGRLFTLFQRLNPGDKYPGSGVGLAVAKKIVARHGGRIWVESRQGKGSTFFFSISARTTRAENGKQ